MLDVAAAEGVGGDFLAVRGVLLEVRGGKSIHIGTGVRISAGRYVPYYMKPCW